MRKVSLIAFLLICSASMSVFAQDKAPLQKAASPPATTETEQPKSEVDRAFEEAIERGETILTRCIVNCDEDGNTQGVEAGRAIELPKPAYPAIARAAHASGSVEVKVIIGVDGNVIAAAAINGHPLLMAAAVSAARDSRFTPTKVNGVPVKVLGVITYNFVSQ